MHCPTDVEFDQPVVTPCDPASLPLEYVGAVAHHQALQRLFSRLVDTIKLPQVAQRILEVAADPNSSPRDMCDAVKSDPVMGTHILRRVNSSNRSMASRVADLTTAISLLGIPEIRNIGLSVFVSRMFDPPGNFRAYDRSRLWRHCCGVAFTARKIARMTGRVSSDEGFVTGLLHHTGTILLDHQLRHHFCRVISQLDRSRRTCDVEEANYSFDQAQLSAYVARQWGFPATISDAIRYYRFPRHYTGPHAEHVGLLAVADYLCHRAGWTSLGVRNVKAPPDTAFAALGMTKIDLAIIWDDLKTSLHEAVL